MGVLWLVIVVLLVLWIFGGFIVPVGGSLIHILLVIALVVLIYDLLSRRRTL